MNFLENVLLDMGSLGFISPLDNSVIQTGNPVSELLLLLLRKKKEKHYVFIICFSLTAVCLTVLFVYARLFTATIYDVNFTNLLHYELSGANMTPECTENYYVFPLEKIA